MKAENERCGRRPSNRMNALCEKNVALIAIEKIEHILVTALYTNLPMKTENNRITFDSGHMAFYRTRGRRKMKSKVTRTGCV